MQYLCSRVVTAYVGALALAALFLLCRLELQIGAANKPCSTMSSQTKFFIYTVYIFLTSHA